MKFKLKDIENERFPKVNSKHKPPKASDRAKTMDEVFHEILKNPDRR